MPSLALLPGKKPLCVGGKRRTPAAGLRRTREKEADESESPLRSWCSLFGREREIQRRNVYLFVAAVDSTGWLYRTGSFVIPLSARFVCKSICLVFLLPGIVQRTERRFTEASVFRQRGGGAHFFFHLALFLPGAACRSVLFPCC